METEEKAAGWEEHPLSCPLLPVKSLLGQMESFVHSGRPVALWEGHPSKHSAMTQGGWKTHPWGTGNFGSEPPWSSNGWVGECHPPAGRGEGGPRAQGKGEQGEGRGPSIQALRWSCPPNPEVSASPGAASPPRMYCIHAGAATPLPGIHAQAGSLPQHVWGAAGSRAALGNGMKVGSEGCGSATGMKGAELSPSHVSLIRDRLLS